MGQQQQLLTEAKLPADREAPSLRARILGKAIQYGEGILINLLSAVTILGLLWVTQQLWNLRLIPFNLLDALILTGVVSLCLLVAVLLLLYYLMARYLAKHPNVVLWLGLILLAGAFLVNYVKGHPEFVVKAAEDMQQNTEQEK